MMLQVSILEAKTKFSQLVRLIETKQEDHIIVSRHGKPVLKMVSYNDAPIENRIGIAKGKLLCPDDFDACNDEIAALFGGEK